MVEIRAMTMADYPAAYQLWSTTEGVGLNESDAPGPIEAFLSRNPGLSLVAVDRDGTIVGTLLCGHDGRRGYLHHLAVATSHRRRGIATRLVDAAMMGLRTLGIVKCNLFLYTLNAAGGAFWLADGWHERTDLKVMQKRP